VAIDRGDRDEQHRENMNKLADYARVLALTVQQRRDGSFSAKNRTLDLSLSVIYDYGQGFEVWNYTDESPLQNRTYDEVSELLYGIA
jgi:hypothetical protein